MSERESQWWLASLDQHGNPTLIDGAHSGMAGAEQALALYRKLCREGFLGTPGSAFKPIERPAIVRVEFYPAPRDSRAAGEGK